MSISDATIKVLTNRDGAAGVEFALMMPTLVLFVIGIVDVGALTYQQTEVSAAAHAGAQYAMNNASATTDSIRSAVTNATPLGTSTSWVTPTVAQGYACSNASPISLSSTPPTNCSPGVVATYIQVNSSAVYTPLITWGTISIPTTLSAQAMVRTQ